MLLLNELFKMDQGAQKYTRSISGVTENVELTDTDLPGIIQSGLQECWENKLFFDTEILTCDGLVKSHKIILASVSPFFRAAFSTLHQLHTQDDQNQINLKILSTSTMNRILQYIYTKKIELNGEVVEELIIAANFLQMSTLEKMCSDFIFDNFDKSNIIDIVNFAVNRSLVFLEDKCQTYVQENFRSILDSGQLFKLPVDQFENVVKHDGLIAKDEKDFIPPSSIQEMIIFTAILKYVQLMNFDAPKESTLKRLLKHVRFDLIMNFEYQSLQKEVSAISDRKLASLCMQTLTKAVDVDKVKPFDEIKATGGQLPRLFSLTHPSKTEKIAHGYIRNIRQNFDDDKEGIHRYIKGMKIWIRRWDGRPVYGAVEVLYSDGTKVFHGQRSNHEVYSFILEPDEFIVEVVAFSGYMVDNLLFTTNTGKKYGPYGGDGGGRRVFTPPSEAGYLASISGSEADTQGSIGIVNLSFHWVSYGSGPSDNHEPQEDDRILAWEGMDSDESYELNYE